MDPRVDIYKAALSHQTGAGFDLFCTKADLNFDKDLTSLYFKAEANMDRVSVICFVVFGAFFDQ